jgi:arsenite methyltransferase
MSSTRSAASESDVPAGKIDLQRLFYWHIAKAYYRREMIFDEMNHINYDWYAPANAARQTPEEVRSCCTEFRLEVEREEVQDAVVTIVARRIRG